VPISNPLFDPGTSPTGRATGALVTGCRVVTVAATKADGAPVPIKHCAATDEPIGVAADDCPQDATIAIRRPGMVTPVLVGGTGVTAGEKVEVMATGVVQDLAAGKLVGISWTTTAAAGFALIDLRFA
jgi:hypothetical protein